MNKKLGLILMFVGAYIVLLGGLFWNMSLPIPTPEGVHPGNVYDWFWGVSAGIVICTGAALAIKRNKLCLLGCLISLIGVAYSIGILIVGNNVEGYFSPFLLIGAVVTILATIITFIFYFREATHIKKHGQILM